MYWSLSRSDRSDRRSALRWWRKFDGWNNDKKSINWHLVLVVYHSVSTRVILLKGRAYIHAYWTCMCSVYVICKVVHVVLYNTQRTAYTYAHTRSIAAALAMAGLWAHSEASGGFLSVRTFCSARCTALSVAWPCVCVLHRDRLFSFSCTRCLCVIQIRWHHVILPNFRLKCT